MKQPRRVLADFGFGKKKESFAFNSPNFSIILPYLEPSF